MRMIVAAAMALAVRLLMFVVMVMFMVVTVVMAVSRLVRVVGRLPCNGMIVTAATAAARRFRLGGVVVG
ncbi:hypothetical protein MMB19_20895 [Ralstonia insidiosa]|jgi:hypothetical protein|nr:hypothetical protein MMB19_20895 [Ralstonia insidiosa]